MNDKSSHKKFEQFATKLKALRSQASRTPAEVCSAVEIDESRLRAYENGESIPTEDILMLLINHFDLDEKRAHELWKLAGYRGKPSEEAYFGDFGMGDGPDNGSDMPRVEHAVIGLSIQDPRVIYTDMVQIMANDHGVIMNFMQGAGSGKQPLAASRVGMSKEHARSVLKMLEKTLDEADRAQSSRRLGGGKGYSPKPDTKH